MNISIAQHDSVTIVTLTNAISHDDIPALRNRLADLIDKKQCRIALDLKNIGYLSSKALAVLIDTRAAAEKLGGDLVIANANQLIVNLFEMTRLNQKIRLFDDTDRAIAWFCRDPNLLS